MTTEEDELVCDLDVIAAATPGPWFVHVVDDDVCMNARTVSTALGSGELDDHQNNVAVLLLQSPRYADVSDGAWDHNAEFIARARGRWPQVLESINQLRKQLNDLIRENRELRAKLDATVAR